MEHLYACCLLWALGFTNGESYADALHSSFRDRPESPTLFALEEAFPDAGRSLSLLEATCAAGDSGFSQAAFAKALFTGLRAVYTENHFDLVIFGKKCYALWKALPSSLRDQEPFFTLSYAQDSLTWGDETAMRAHLEEAFVRACG